ncbi:hypothetical protein FKP32DRAFT_1607168 [Trametes sanguinea]|nr:hypothetical protein FKP32DRAFT_1607168 [Trametes sanguinea]
MHESRRWACRTWLWIYNGPTIMHESRRWQWIYNGPTIMHESRSRAGPRYVTALARAEDLRSTVTSLEREVRRELASLAVGLEEAFREHEEQFPGFEQPQRMEEGEVCPDVEEVAEEMEAEEDIEAEGDAP